MNSTQLKAAGIDYQQGLRRFANKPELYEKYLVKFFSDPAFVQLGEQLAAKDCQRAFQTAHTLKGMSGNLSMNAFYDSLCVLVEQLRGNQLAGADGRYAQLSQLYDEMKAAILDETGGGQPILGKSGN